MELYYKAEKRDVALERIKRRWLLNSLSSQCANGKWSFARKPEYIPKTFNDKKTFQKCNPPDFKFYLVKSFFFFSIWCNVNFMSVFTALEQRKFNITPYGENFY